MIDLTEDELMEIVSGYLPIWSYGLLLCLWCGEYHHAVYCVYNTKMECPNCGNMSCVECD